MSPDTLTKEATMKKPSIKTALPGPKAKAILAKDDKYISPSYTRSYPLVIEKGEGNWVTDVDGNVFLDFTAGIAVNSTGHCHPRVVEAVKKQADKFLHMSGTDFYYELQSQLAEQLSAMTPGAGTKRVFLSNSGTEATECAMKLARYKTGRHGFLAFHGAFHGRTMGALSLTSSKSIHKGRMGPFLAGVTHATYPNPYRNPTQLTAEEYGAYCVETIEKEYFKRHVAPEDLAGIVLETIQGEGGYIVPPKSFLLKLRELCNKHGILLLCDEVQSGNGRTGKMWAFEHFGVQPDIFWTAKGIASGLPLGATIASEKIMDWPSGAHANTFGGNPLACAAAIETLKLLQESLIENARTVGDYLKAELQKVAEKSSCIGDVRGLGLMIGVEIVKDKKSKEPDPKKRDEIVQKCFEKGLLLLGAGANAIRFCSGLGVTRDEANEAVEQFLVALA